MTCYFWCHVIFFAMCNSLLNNLCNCKILVCFPTWTHTLRCLSPKVTQMKVWSPKESKENLVLMSANTVFHVRVSLPDFKPKHKSVLWLQVFHPQVFQTHKRSSVNIFLKCRWCQRIWHLPKTPANIHFKGPGVDYSLCESDEGRLSPRIQGRTPQDQPGGSLASHRKKSNVSQRKGNRAYWMV